MNQLKIEKNHYDCLCDNNRNHIGIDGCRLARFKSEYSSLLEKFSSKLALVLFFSIDFLFGIVHSHFFSFLPFLCLSPITPIVVKQNKTNHAHTHTAKTYAIQPTNQPINQPTKQPKGANWRPNCKCSPSFVLQN